MSTSIFSILDPHSKKNVLSRKGKGNNIEQEKEREMILNDDQTSAVYLIFFYILLKRSLSLNPLQYNGNGGRNKQINEK